MRAKMLVACGTTLVMAAAASAAGQSDEQPNDAVYITGEHSLLRMLSSGETTRAEDGVQCLRGLEAIQLDGFSDARFSGETHVVHGEDVYASGLGPRWGTAVMENEGGSWHGSYIAWVLPRDDGPDVPIYTTLFEGQGGYEGWSALCHSIYPQGRGWDGEAECVLFPGPQPRLILPE